MIDRGGQHTFFGLITVNQQELSKRKTRCVHKPIFIHSERKQGNQSWVPPPPNPHPPRFARLPQHRAAHGGNGPSIERDGWNYFKQSVQINYRFFVRFFNYGQNFVSWKKPLSLLICLPALLRVIVAVETCYNTVLWALLIWSLFFFTTLLTAHLC